MAINITNVPRIQGPNYGGVIYGLNVELGYSSEPSTLILEIVSESGLFTITPSALNTLVTIRVGNFSFIGYVWEYEIDKSAEQSTLKVTIKDGSIILDRYYVLLWQPGIFGFGGKSKIIKKTFKFEGADNSALLPCIDARDNLVFIEKKLKNQILDIPVKYYSGKKGNVLILGTEQPPDNKCDISTCDYSFDELAAISPISLAGAIGIEKNFRATYSGQLRDVLNNWCEKFGVSFYWDFSTNQIKFYDTLRGINYVKQNLNDPTIISSKEKASKAGTFAQYLISWAAKPKEKVVSKSSNYTYQITNSRSPIPISSMLGKRAMRTEPRPTEGSDTRTERKYGPGAFDENGNLKYRTQSEFIQSAVYAQYSEELRQLFLFYKGWRILSGIIPGGGWSSDYETQNDRDDEAEKREELLKIFKAYDIDISELEKTSPKLKNHDIIIGYYNEKMYEKWRDIELYYFKYLGRFYRSYHGASFVTTYCSPTLTATISINRSDNGTIRPDDIEGLKDVNNLGWCIDKGEASVTPGLAQFQTDLGLDELGAMDKLKNAVEIIRPDNLMLESLLKAKFIKEKNNQVIFLLSKDRYRFRSSMGIAPHPTETTTADQAKTSSERNKCKTYEDYVKHSCENYRDIAKEKAEKEAQKGCIDTDKIENNLVGGYAFPAPCYVVHTYFMGKYAKAYTRTFGQYVFLTDISIEYQTVSKFTQQKDAFYTEGNVGTADNAEKIEIILHNATDNNEDSWRTPIQTSRTIGKSVVFDTHVDEQTITYAGIPNIPLSPSNGLKSLNMSLSNDGFKTTVTYSDHPPRRIQTDDFQERAEYLLKRNSFNAN